MERNQSKLNAVLALAIIALVVSQLPLGEGPSFSLSAQGLSPVLKAQESTGLNEVPFLAEALRDPELAQRKPSDDQDAMRLAHDVKEFRSDLTRTPKGERAIELNQEAYQGAVALAYYFEDVVSGRAQGDKKVAAQSLISVRSMALLHAEQSAKMAHGASARAKAEFHVHALRFVMGKNRSSAVDGLRKLEQGKSLEQALRTKARMLVGMSDVESNGPARVNGQAMLRRGAQGAEAQVATRLVLARSLAGLSKSGKKVRAADNKYRAQLYAASEKAQSLDESQKAPVLRYIIGVWRAAEGHSASWDKPPFKMNAFKASPEIKGILERVAIADWNHGLRAQAIKKYEGLSKSLVGTAYKAPVDRRLLDLYRAEYQASKSPAAYQRALLQRANEYLDTGVLGDGREKDAQAMQSEVARRHEALVKGELTRVASQRATSKERVSAINMAERFLGTISDNSRIEDIKARIAGVYAMNKQHREAVAIYSELAETGNANLKRRYLSLAIGSQSVLARWPGQAPWAGIKAGNVEEREQLLALYKKMDELDKQKIDWFMLAQIGLLEINLGRGEAAFSAWTAALKSSPEGAHAANAAGMMLVSYQTAGSWASLEDLARLCLKQGIAAAHRGSRVALQDMLALALLEGGKDAIEEGKFSVAVAKLKEFVENHKSAKNHDEGFYLLATAYRGAGKHPESIKTLLAFVETYPSSKYLRAALLSGGDWSAPMAFEENAMFFYRRFLATFAKDQEARRVRETLVPLYLGRSHYSDAVFVLSMTVKASDADAATKSAALLQIMDIEDRQGSAERAESAANTLIAASDVESEAKAEAYALKARRAARHGRYPELLQIASALEGLGSGAIQQDALGEARFLYANGLAKGSIKQTFNLALTDPSAALEKRFEAYRAARAHFQRVCEAGQTSYCAPSLYQLARLSEDFIRSVEDIEIQTDLAKDVVQRFNARKQAIMSEATRAAQSSDDRAVMVTSEGHTDPDWTQAVLWHNSADWTFDRVSGETGNGYVQWSSGSKAAE